MRSALWIFVIAVLSFSWTLPVRAQRSLDIGQFEPALDRHGFLGVQGTRMPGHFKTNMGMWFSWAEQPLRVRVGEGEGAQTRDVIGRRLSADFLAQVGLGSRVALAMNVPVTLWQSTQASVLGDGGGSLPVSAFGDPRLIGRVRVLGEGTEGDQTRSEGFGLALQGASTLPIGKEGAFTAEAAAVTDLRVQADFRLLGAGIGLQLGWRHRFEPVDVGSVTFRDEWHYGLGVEVPIPLVKGLSALAEVRGTTDAASPFGDEARTPVEGDVGVQWNHGDVTVTGAVGAGFTSGTGSPKVRGLVGLSYAPRKNDADEDGIADDVDECPHLPEDFDGFEDEDGCLDPDNDNDLVPDSDDECPNEAADPYRDADQDGCTDPVRDRDGDGVEDRRDSCPGRAEDRDGYQDEDGCPEPGSGSDKPQ